MDLPITLVKPPVWQQCRAVSTDATAGAWLAGRRMGSVDGMCLDVADTADYAEFLGRPGVTEGEQAAFPQTRMLALAECGTHAVFAAEIGRYPQSEATPTRSLLDRLEPGTILMDDLGYFSNALWRRAIGTGADLLWRVSPGGSGLNPAHAGDLPDGAWLTHLRHSTPARSAPDLDRVSFVAAAIAAARAQDGAAASLLPGGVRPLVDDRLFVDIHATLAFADHGAGGIGTPGAAILRPGNAGSNTATDHVAVTAPTLAQFYSGQQNRVLVRADSAGGTKAFTHHLADANLACSVGFHGSLAHRKRRSTPSRKAPGSRRSMQAGICATAHRSRKSSTCATGPPGCAWSPGWNAPTQARS